MSWVQIPSPTPNILSFCPSLVFFENSLPCAKAAAGSGYHGEMIPIRCRGLLFDLDGVLVDSTPAVARGWGGWGRGHGVEAGEGVRKGHGGPSSATSPETLPGA